MRAMAAMATLPALLLSKNSSFFTPAPAPSLRRFHASKNAILRQSAPQCSHDPISLPTDAPSPASTSSFQAEVVPISVSSAQSGRRFVGLHGQASCVLGLGAVAGTMMAFPHHANAAEVASSLDTWSALVASEPKNALSLPTWVIHVASVAEWITAMALVWRYGDTPGNSTWKGLSWGMVPLLGGAMCACTWHFFYNAQSLEILVVLQAALTVIGNCTMWAAAFRIYQSSQKQSKSS